MIRSATRRDARRIHALITTNQAEGHLLPRSLPEIEEHAHRFVVATARRRIVACGELAPLSATMAEIRSLVVDPAQRAQGVGRRLVGELRRLAAVRGFEQLCAFTHEPAYFARLGFAVTAHGAIPEKIAKDCQHCPLFGRCGQTAVVWDVAPIQVDTEATEGRIWRSGDLAISRFIE